MLYGGGVYIDIRYILFFHDYPRLFLLRVCQAIVLCFILQYFVTNRKSMEKLFRRRLGDIPGKEENGEEKENLDGEEDADAGFMADRRIVERDDKVYQTGCIFFCLTPPPPPPRWENTNFFFFLKNFFFI